MKITGDKEVDKALANLDKKVAKKILRQSMKVALKPLKQEVENEIPVDSGLSKSLIKIRPGKRSRSGQSMLVDIKGDGETFYTQYVEYGTSKQKPNPFMRRAFDKEAKNTRAIAIDEIKKRIEGEK